MTSLVHMAVVIVTTATITLGSRWLSRRTKPAELDDGGGRITPGKVSAAIVVLFGVVLSTIGVAAIWSGALAIGSLTLVVGGALAAFMAPSLTRWHDVIWTATAIEGPSRMFGPTLGLARTRIRWDEIARTGGTVTGYSFVETADRRRVYWSYLYRGFAIFEEKLSVHRPDLSGDEAAEMRQRTTVGGLDGAHHRTPARPVIETPDMPLKSDDPPV